MVGCMPRLLLVHMYSKLAKCIYYLLSNLVDNRDIRTRTRNATTFKVTFPKKEKFKTNTLFRGALDWNALDIYTRNIDSKFSFKKKQKEWALLQNEIPQ